MTNAESIFGRACSSLRSRFLRLFCAFAVAMPIPELPSEETRAALNDLLIRVRLDSLRKSSV